MFRYETLLEAPQDGLTPLHVAAGNDHPEVARALLEAQADITAKDHVSEGGGGGEGHRIRQSRDFVELWQTSEELHTPARMKRLLSVLIDDARAQKCVDDQGSLLHKMRLSGCWACLRVRVG